MQVTKILPITAGLILAPLAVHSQQSTNAYHTDIKPVTKFYNFDEKNGITNPITGKFIDCKVSVSSYGEKNTSNEVIITFGDEDASFKTVDFNAEKTVRSYKLNTNSLKFADCTKIRANGKYEDTGRKYYVNGQLKTTEQNISPDKENSSKRKSEITPACEIEISQNLYNRLLELTDNNIPQMYEMIFLEEMPDGSFKEVSNEKTLSGWCE